MKTIMSLSMGSLLLPALLGIPVVSPRRPSEKSAREQFVGAWRLVAVEEPDSSAKSHRCDCTGMFVFTRDGHASVQVMSRETGASAGSEQYSTGGYEASFGTYAVDPRTHTFTFHIEGALVRTLIGKDLPRLYSFSGKRLVIKPTSAAEHWSVIWERY